jgi:hypothetical protein
VSFHPGIDHASPVLSVTGLICGLQAGVLDHPVASTVFFLQFALQGPETSVRYGRKSNWVPARQTRVGAAIV